MADSMSEDNTYSKQVVADFFRELGETLDELEVVTANLRSGDVANDEGMELLLAECTKIQQLAYWAHQPFIDLTLRRLVNYVSDLDQPDECQMDDVCAFLDVVRGILDGEIDEKTTDQAEFVRSLPARRAADVGDTDHLAIEVLVVDPQRSSARIFERELRNCGYRVSSVHHFFEALELTVRTRPDLVISSAVLDQLSGVDLARSIGAISPTHAIPFALLTSFERDHELVQGLPDHAAILRKGEGFGEDLADALERFHII
jgi:CheY-like chemotaxis protein